MPTPAANPVTVITNAGRAMGNAESRYAESAPSCLKILFMLSILARTGAPFEPASRHFTGRDSLTGEVGPALGRRRGGAGSGRFSSGR
ncbi:hypothetical protein GCM10009830_02590 [Glycomyces endophyticus]|uniref:Serine hydrolase n=1 Tax=Glycomyces endophyticus TaxID=480996 RepID=A0ABP4RW61_9ACTN